MLKDIYMGRDKTKTKTCDCYAILDTFKYYLHLLCSAHFFFYDFILFNDYIVSDWLSCLRACLGCFIGWSVRCYCTVLLGSDFQKQIKPISDRAILNLCSGNPLYGYRNNVWSWCFYWCLNTKALQHAMRLCFWCRQTNTWGLVVTKFSVCALGSGRYSLFPF